MNKAKPIPQQEHEKQSWQPMHQTKQQQEQEQP